MCMMLQLQAFNERTFTVTLKNLSVGTRLIYCAVYPTTDQSVSPHSSHAHKIPPCVDSIHSPEHLSIEHYNIERQFAGSSLTLNDNTRNPP